MFNVGDIVLINDPKTLSTHGERAEVEGWMFSVGEYAVKMLTGKYTGVSISYKPANLMPLQSMATITSHPTHSNGQPVVQLKYTPSPFTKAMNDIEEELCKEMFGVPTRDQYGNVKEEHSHQWKKYFGLNEKFQYCDHEGCKEKRDYDA